MKKHFYAFMLLALVGVSTIALGACEGGSTQEEGYSITITNKAQLQESWPIGEPNRSLSIELDPVSNATTEVATGNLVVTSSNTDAVVATGLSLTAVGLGEATITASWHGASDSVDVAVVANSYKTIASINAGINDGSIKSGDAVSFYGQVVASMEPSTTHMYSGIYLGDGDDSIMLYSGQVDNYFFDANGDLAIEYGTNIGVSATYSPYNGLNEFAPTYIEVLDGSYSVTTPEVKELSESDYNALTDTDVGKLAKMELTYVSGTVSTEEKTHSTINAKIGDTDVNYYVNYHNGTDEIAALANKINTLDEGDTFTSYGVISWYGGKPELCPNFMLVNGEVITPSECVTVPEKIAPTELKITGSNSVTIRSTTTLEITVNEGASRLVTWESSDESVATVSDGVVFGAGIGTANITATSTLDSSISDTIAITVGYITAPEKYNSETNYYLGFDLTEVSNEGIYLFNGTLSGNYGATTQKEAEAAVITYTPVKDTAEGGCIGFQLTFTDSTGNTQYIAMNESHYFTFTSEPYTLGYSAEYDTFTALDGTSEYYFGTYASNGSYYKTISCSRISYAATSVTSTLFTSDDLPGAVAPTSVTVSAPTTSIYPGETIQLSVTVDEGADDSVTYSVISGQDYVSVTEDGAVTGLTIATAGSAVIRATAKTAPDNGEAAYGEITISLTAIPSLETETIAADSFGYSNTADISEIYGSLTKVSFEANGGSQPKYYTGNPGSFRVYRYNTVTFDLRAASASISKIELNCVDPYTSTDSTTGETTTTNYDGVPGMSATNATVSQSEDHKLVTITPTNGSSEVVLTNSDGTTTNVQLRITSIVITYTSLSAG